MLLEPSSRPVSGSLLITHITSSGASQGQMSRGTGCVIKANKLILVILDRALIIPLLARPTAGENAY